MESSSDKKWAAKYLLDPLTEPQPSQEDGPGTSFRTDAAGNTAVSPKVQSPPSTSKRLSKNPYRKSSGATSNAEEIKRSLSLQSTGATSPSPSSGSPKIAQSPTSHRQDVMSNAGSSGRRRGSSLTERFPGDISHRPLDTLTKEKASADRSRHVTKKHQIRPDTIDNLDSTSGAYHHAGPYDVTYLARNNSSNSPLAALADSNAEALKATPHEKIADSVQGHRPLDGVAAYAPGERDRNGHLYQYRQGENMMIDLSPEGGAYKRWPGIHYDPDDIKGKGESYSLEKALKDHNLDEKNHRKVMGNGDIEMKTRNRSSGNGLPNEGWDDGENKMNRNGSLSKRLSGGGLKKKIGSIKRHLQNDN